MKSHFKFTSGQRNGIFLLISIIIVLQCVYVYTNNTDNYLDVHDSEVNKFQKEIDALKALEIENSKPKIFPFNPNYITDYKGYTLGMSSEEINRLTRYREQNKWVNSTQQFQQVTNISDSLLSVISPYFKFPEWVTNPKPKYSISYDNSPKTYDQKIDLNIASVNQLQRVNGIGEKLSERIVKFRNKFKDGFIADVQLQDVYGVSPEVLERLLNEFTVKTPRPIIKINLNTATVEQLVTIQHIDYELAYEIIEYRTLIEGYKLFNELLKVKEFPVDKIEIIKLYLMLQ